jgi:uncharacterized protein
MLTIISPAKSLNFDNLNKEVNSSLPNFLNQSSEIISVVKKLDNNELMSLMSISNDLAQLNYDRFQSWSLPFNKDNSKQAVFSFNGDVYKGLDVDTFSDEDLDYSQNHLRILSGLYGLLKPLDIIQPYRLEMGTKLSINGSKNLYDFWKETITESVNQEIKDKGHKYLLNLASNEYFNSIDKKKINAEIIYPVFKDFKNGEYKVISFYAKKARGLMSRYHIKNKVETLEDIKSFNEQGYYFSSEMSENNKIVFIRDSQ